MLVIRVCCLRSTYQRPCEPLRMPRGGALGHSGCHLRFPYQRVRFLCHLAIYIIWTHRRYVEFRYPFTRSYNVAFLRNCEVCIISRHRFPICTFCTYAPLSYVMLFSCRGGLRSTEHAPVRNDRPLLRPATLPRYRAQLNGLRTWNAHLQPHV